MKNHYFFSQPHQPFFLLAFINAIISMFIFMLIFKGIIPSEISSRYYHAYSLIYMLFTPAFLAFLFTTFSRFSNTEPIAQQHYLKVLSFYAGGSLLFQLGTFFSSTLLSFSVLLLFIAHLYAVKLLVNIYQNSEMEDKEDQSWILIGMGIGLFAHFLFFISLWATSLLTFSIQLSIYLYLFVLIFTIAQRMVPFFAHITIEKHRERLKVIVGLLTLHVLLEVIQTHSSFLVDLLLGYLLGREIWRWKLPFPNQNPLVWILIVSLFWLPVAFILSSITNLISLSNGSNFLLLDIHTLVLGFFFTILIGFGTRVTLGHSGNVLKADNLTSILFYWTQLVVVMRILTSLSVANGWGFVVFFDLSLTTWIVLFALWGSRFFPILIFGKKLDEE